jgi:hypothetical protein
VVRLDLTARPDSPSSAVSAAALARRAVRHSAEPLASGLPATEASSPITAPSVVAGQVTSTGAGDPSHPVPATPVSSVVDGLWLARREVDRKPAGASVTGHTALAGEPSELSQWQSSDGSRVVYTAGSDADTKVAVFDVASGEQVGHTVTLSGAGLRTVEFSADGSRATVTTRIFDVDPASTEISSTNVAVIDTATGGQVGSTFTLAGDGSTMMTADGSRAVITSRVHSWVTGYTTRVAVIDTLGGVQAGSTMTLAGYGTAALSTDGSRAVVAAAVSDSATTGVVVLDTSTGSQVGATLTVAGSASTVLIADGARAVVTSSIYDPVTGSGSTGVTVVDTSTGSQVGATLTVAGSDSTVLNAKGSRAVVTAKPYGSVGGPTSIAVVDTQTGAQVGATVAVTGDGSTALNADGSRAVVTANPYDSVHGSTSVTVVDTVTGAQVGATVCVVGNGSTVLSADGSRAVLTARVLDLITYHSSSTSWAVIDTGTGDQVGATFTLAGEGSTILSADGSRAVVAAGAYDSAIYGTSTTSWAVIDTADGSQVGATFTRAGAGSTVLSADGSRAILTTSSSGLGNPADSLTVAVIDTATGNQVGSNLATPPGGVQSAVLNGDGSRAVVTIRRYDSGSFSFSSAVMVIDTATGDQVGSTLTLEGSASTSLTADGSRAVAITDTLRVAIIDTATGNQVGSTLDVPGVPLDALGNDMVLSADGARLLIASFPAAQSAVLGALQFVAAVLFVPLMIFFPVLGPALQFAQSFQAENWTVIDTRTGAQVGSTITVSGLDSVQFWRAPSPIISADGSRALVVGFTRWDWSNLFRLSTRVTTMRID